VVPLVPISVALDLVWLVVLLLELALVEQSE
jgi:hypothetical protein